MKKSPIPDEYKPHLKKGLMHYKDDWNGYARNILKVRLDESQQEILHAIQTNKKISVRSGNARGKDYVAAVASICFLNLYMPSKVINTGPTGRQAISIMMSEIAKIYSQIEESRRGLTGGLVLSNQIKMRDPDHYLLAFKAKDKSVEAWSGFHSPNLMVVVTEASGIEQETFNAIESILTGNSKLVIVFNPNQMKGEAYRSVKDPTYKKFKLSCLDAPNVLAKETIIPGQVDYDWVLDKVHKWCVEIDGSIASETENDFKFENNWYRPNDLFLVKVMGEFPREGEDKLIPLPWIETAMQRWEEHKEDYNRETELKVGIDIAGMGRDMTVFCFRRGNFVERFESIAKSDHMATVGKIRNYLARSPKSTGYVDTIGEGAGVYSRLREQEANVRSVKFSESAKGWHDYSRQVSFVNMRAYCYWAIRDALDPRNGYELCLPPNDSLMEDLNEPLWKTRSDGSILIEEKEEIRKRLGRSPDYGDALALTFYPKGRMPVEDRPAVKGDYGSWRHQDDEGLFGVEKGWLFGKE